MTATAFEDTSIPPIADPEDDDVPPAVNPTPHTVDTSTYPDATPDAPYGYTKSGRKRSRPLGTTTRGSSRGNMPASESQARAAAALLAAGNTMIGGSLIMFGLPMTGAAINQANSDFEEFAYQALLTDPALCKAIAQGGALSGKAMLFMAYASLSIQVVPVARGEFIARRDAAREELQ